MASFRHRISRANNVITVSVLIWTGSCTDSFVESVGSAPPGVSAVVTQLRGSSSSVARILVNDPGSNEYLALVVPHGLTLSSGGSAPVEALCDRAAAEQVFTIETKQGTAQLQIVLGTWTGREADGPPPARCGDSPLLVARESFVAMVPGAPAVSTDAGEAGQSPTHPEAPDASATQKEVAPAPGGDAMAGGRGG